MAILQLKGIVYLLFLALAITCSTSARILDEDDSAVPAVAPDPEETPVSTVTTTVAGIAPGGATGAAAGTAPGGTTGAAVGTALGGTTGAAVGTAPGGITGAAVGTAPGGSTGTAVGATGHDLSFFMHDILGGSNPSARAVTGVVSNPAINGQVPFAKPNGAVLPVNNGVPTNNGNSGILNNNNLPFLTGLGGTTSNVIQNNGNNNNFNGGSGFPFLNNAQLPGGNTIQKLMFGTMTVFDDELTEGHNLGSGLVGKAQGFYVSSSIDGNSQTMAFTAMFESGGYADSLCFFGVHRTAVSESHLAIMGGTGKYLNAKGFATVKTIPATNQHSTDGVETLLEITVYLAY